MGSRVTYRTNPRVRLSLYRDEPAPMIRSMLKKTSGMNPSGHDGI
jgi:hypothetical protein